MNEMTFHQVKSSIIFRLDGIKNSRKVFSQAPGYDEQYKSNVKECGTRMSRHLVLSFLIHLI